MTMKSLTVCVEGAEHRLYQECFHSSTDVFDNPQTATKCHRTLKFRRDNIQWTETQQWKDKADWSILSNSGSKLIGIARRPHPRCSPWRGPNTQASKMSWLKKLMPLAESCLWCHVHSASMKQMTPTSMCSKCNCCLCTDQNFLYLPYKDKLINQSSVINGKANSTWNAIHWNLCT